MTPCLETPAFTIFHGINISRITVLMRFYFGFYFQESVTGSIDNIHYAPGAMPVAN